MPNLQIDGIGTIEVDDGFKNLSPDQQNAFVENVVGQIKQGGQQPQPAPQPQTQPMQSPAESEQIAGKNQAYLQENLPASQGIVGLETVENVGRGINIGLGNAAVGAFQAATDVGEKAASLIERLYFGDNLNMDTIGSRLANQVKQRNELQAQLPTSQRVGVAIGQSLPYLATGVGTGAKVAQAVAQGGKIAKFFAPIAGLATSGAVSGFASGTLSPQEEVGLENRSIQTVKSGATGAVIGGGLGVAGKAVGAGVKAGKSLITAKSAEDILAARLPKEQTASLLNELKTATPENPVILPDIAGDSIKGLTRSVAKISGAKDLVVDALEKRSEESITRVANHLSKDISPVNSYFDSIDDLIKARSEISQPLYKQAYAEGNKNIQKLLKPQIVTKNEFVSDGLGGIKEQITKTEIPADPLFSNPNVQKYISKAKNEPLFVDPRISNNDFAVLDGAKKMIDDDIGSAMRAGENERARALIGIKNQIVNKLDEVSPLYKQARQVFGGFSQLKKAQEEGLDFSKLNPEEIQRQMQKFSTGEKDAYRIGVKENLKDINSSTADGLSSAKRIFGNKQKRDQLKAVFGNEAKFNEFEKKMVAEFRATDTKTKVLGGSRTDFNMSGDEEFMNKIISGGIGVLKSKINPLYLLEAAHNAITNKFSGINEKNAVDLAKILVNRQDAIKALENIIQKQNNPLQKRVLTDAKEYFTTNAITQTTNQ